MRYVRCHALVLLATLCAGCNTEVTVRETDPTGTLRLDVVDTAGRVQGAVLEFTDPRGRQFQGVTTAANPLQTVAWPGVWTVRVTPPATHTISPSQPNPASVTVVADETREIVFMLTRKSP